MEITFIPPTTEDRVKSNLYSEVTEEDISEYTRQCMRNYDEERYKKPIEKLTKKRNYSLEEVLFELVIKHEAADKEEKRKIDILALKTIRRCCKGSFRFIREYYRFYRDMKNGVFYIT